MTYPTHSPDPHQPLPPPGMYLDPDGTGYRRWWDGRQWHPVQVPAAPGPTAGQKFATWVKAHPKASGSIAAAVVIVGIAGSAGGEDPEKAPDKAADTSSTVVRADDDPNADEVAVADPAPAPEPVDTDGDGATDDVDVRPGDPKIQTEDDVDTDKDGTADYQDAFPKDPAFSLDTDGDRVADSVDDFPKDERYSTDSDGDEVADSVDDFPADPSRSEITAAMQNAIDAAESYLDYTAFSRSGLIKQLEFEDYDTEDATFAVDYLGVNWNEQAVKSAESYLDYTSFSRDGLIDQLQFEGYTYDQAAYGVSKAY